jgi:translation initiation factor 2 alpha subunit (eIF-2alpha)
VLEEAKNTALENIFEQLEIDKETAYESFIIKINQSYNNEIDMYGDIKKAGESNLKVRYPKLKNYIINPSILYRSWNSEFPFPMI